MKTICRSDDLTVPPLVGCCLWNHQLGIVFGARVRVNLVGGKGWVKYFSLDFCGSLNPFIFLYILQLIYYFDWCTKTSADYLDHYYMQAI